LPLHEKAPAQKREDEPGKGANQSASEPSQGKADAPADAQGKADAPADAEARPQSAGQTASQKQVPAGSYDFHSDQWAALYAKRIDSMIAALKSKGRISRR
jgi:hypothetical protein